MIIMDYSDVVNHLLLVDYKTHTLVTKIKADIGLPQFFFQKNKSDISKSEQNKIKLNRTKYTVEEIE